jgi:RNA methyltransferase, TrmH family
VPEITSRRHPVVKDFSAAADAGDDGRAVIDGWHLVHEAHDARFRFETVAVTDAARDVDARLLDELQAGGARVLTVSPEVLDGLSPVRTPTGIVAVVQRRRVALGDLLRSSAPLVIVAVDVQDPGNLGAIVRAAEAGGGSGVVCAGSCANPWRPKALRASMGSLFRVPVVTHADVAAVCIDLQAAGLAICATTPANGVSIYDADLARPCAILLGGEGPGLSDVVLAMAETRLSIPMCAPVESLNVAVAAGLLVYEARRQRLARTVSAHGVTV